jgi:hypothetical protein
MLVGAAVLVYLHVTGREHWFTKAGEIVEERLEAPEERERRHVV